MVKHNLYVKVVDSPIGKLRLSADSSGLVGLKLAGGEELRQEGADPLALGYIDQAQLWLDEYFTGSGEGLEKFLPQLKLIGTEFQISVWKAAMAIPCGQTTSYGRLAASIGRPRASRAVGTALGKNPILLMVPCHRVLASDGGLGGFTGGLEIKKKLLKIEG